ncbi:efflux RND transporter periplasmic adaptor subunit [Chryseolinea soli]|uniref:Efflux RND transporter periplasmic adaptor subunit n=1 Tax=Chryseolinea soli TaxID=2321403 RepID=A0A385SNC7_9BACT|nr:efflux RND transporter periplasmic adaptor subunit [Chryseolinea soli]AYB32679.1 efflux RND transporter periplasmic adaptor subunit [Chryseolinea soli]
MKSMHIISIIGFLIVLLIGYNLWANKKVLDEKNTPALQSKLRIPVKIAVASEQLHEINMIKTGSIAPFKEVKALALSGGMIRQIRFDLGSHVTEGQVLAVMDMQALQLDLQKAETNASKLQHDLQVYTELLQGKAATQEKVNEISKNYQDALNQVSQVKKNISDAAIKAPISGIISAKPVESGMYANAGSEIATIISLSKAKVAVNLTESEVYQIQQGQSVKIKTDVYPDKSFSGSVSFISPQADETHSYRVEVMMNNTETSLLRSGTFVYVDFSKNTTEKVLVIPREALLESIQNASVYVVSDSVVHQRPIQTGKALGENIQVTRGLRAEEVVVTSGQINLKEGSVVRVSN